MLMSRLKVATAPHHQAVEALMPVMQADLTRQGYAQVLRSLHSVVQPLESALLALPLPLAFELPRRVKAPQLARDLAALGLTAAPGASLTLPGVPEGLGALYVLEGATLGGQIIGRHLRARGITPDSGGAYFSGYGPQTGPMWRAFGAAMNSEVAPEDEARVLAGARQTFDAFGAALRAVAA
ncbi:heme oxygenase [Deinococcus sp. HMF7620]|uniref:Heme oxygenase n=1 Tax=Deinococcus arboris TaxID=2682977 RepID=A0A7C9LQE1_9DEIO|nr:biliverdin-producing heme oxygenase [Deinococcus arboris]MVN86621.1 heme oxygenase [Deinococcus arboris]